MADFINNLTSISWWIGVVITTILLNLAAMYLKSPIDWLAGSISTKYQTRSKAKKAEREVKIKNLVGNKHEQILFASKINLTALTGVFFDLFGILFLILASWLSVLAGFQSPTMMDSLGFKILLSLIPISGCFAVFLGVSHFTEAAYGHQILREAIKRESKVEPK